MKRTRQIMVRLNDEEFARFLARKPVGEEPAAYARRVILDAGAPDESGTELRSAASFIVACLSPDLTFEDALTLFDEHVTPCPEEVADGRGH